MSRHTGRCQLWVPRPGVDTYPKVFANISRNRPCKPVFWRMVMRAEEGSDTNNISLDLSPHLRQHPGCAGVWEGSIEFDLDETGVKPGGTEDGTDTDEG